MKKIKILQFPIANSNGGITHYALNNWKWMDKGRFECDFATMSKHLDFAEDILSTGSRIYYISCYAEENPEQFKSEFRNILKQGYDVVHLHTKQWKSLLVEEVCKEAEIPCVIVHAHSTGIEVTDKEQRQYEVKRHEEVKEKVYEGIATDFWACSGLAAEFLFGSRIPKDKIMIMPNAIELNKFAFDQKIRDEYRKQYRLENCFVIGHVGRFGYSKNHDFLIDVFNEISKKIDNARLVLLGDGQLLPEMKNKVRSLALEEKVIFLGNREDICNWYQAMDIFCFPSRFEGLGLVLIEAQASGLPCVVSEFMPKEAIHSPDTDILPLDKKMWENRIIEETLLSQHRVRNNMSNNNIVNLKEAGYDMNVQIKRIERIYGRG